MTDNVAMQARQHRELIEEIRDPRIAKTEREHAAGREIDRLNARVALLEHRFVWTLHCLGKVHSWAAMWQASRHPPLIDWLAKRVIEAATDDYSVPWPSMDFVKRIAEKQESCLRGCFREMEIEAMTRPKILNPPKEIWLCYGEIEEDAEHKDCAAHEDSVTWCDTPQDYADVRYVLAPEEQKP